MYVRLCVCAVAIPGRDGFEQEIAVREWNRRRAIQESDQGIPCTVLLIYGRGITVLLYAQSYCR